MGLEVGSFPSDLVDTNPTGTDLKSQGDDHLRLIKRVIKNTFPNLNAAVTATPIQMNALASPGTTCFPGMIAMWSGAIGSIPAGWVLCNGSGTISNGNPVPDLRDRFIVGAGASYGVGGTGGSTNGSFAGSTGSSGGAVINVPNTGWGITGGKPGTVEQGRVVVGSGLFENAEELESLRASLSGPNVSVPDHSHTISGTVSTVPPYFALAFIIKT